MPVHIQTVLKLVLFIFPFATVWLFGESSAAGRMIAVAYFWVCCIVFGSILLLRPANVLIDSSAKLARVEFKTRRILVERMMQIGIASLVLFAMWQLTLFARDVYGAVATGSVHVVDGELLRIPTNGLTRWCAETLVIQTESSGTSEYRLFFPLSHPRAGHRYSLEVMPRSKTVVAIREHGPSAATR
ncbi:hypothetical protein BH18VER1_BH18VER1_17630 [soil metagenome]